MDIWNLLFIVFHLIFFICVFNICIFSKKGVLKSLFWSVFLGLTPIAYLLTSIILIFLLIAFIGRREQIKGETTWAKK